jgi:hypothetical protein
MPANWITFGSEAINLEFVKKIHFNAQLSSQGGEGTIWGVIVEYENPDENMEFPHDSPGAVAILKHFGKK